MGAPHDEGQVGLGEASAPEEPRQQLPAAQGGSQEGTALANLAQQRQLEQQQQRLTNAASLQHTSYDSQPAQQHAATQAMLMAEAGLQSGPDGR